MFGLTALGIVHTAISLAVLVSGFWVRARHKQFSPQDARGRTDLVGAGWRTPMMTAFLRSRRY